MENAAGQAVAVVDTLLQVQPVHQGEINLRSLDMVVACMVPLIFQDKTILVLVVEVAALMMGIAPLAALAVLVEVLSSCHRATLISTDLY
jgi:hypothetical protein